MNFGIIAAGEGSRLAQEGVELPKPLVRIDGQPMVGRLVRMFASLGAGKIAVIVNEYMHEVREYLETLRDKEGFPLDIAVKTTPSSMHSFHELASRLGEGRFVLTTVDTIFREADFARYIRAFENAGPEIDGMMAVTAYVDDEKPLWVGVDGSMDITAFRDEAGKGDSVISGGIYGLDGKSFDVVGRCIAAGQSRMRNFQRALVAEGLKLKAYDIGKVLDVDHASDIEKAENFLSGE